MCDCLGCFPSGRKCNSLVLGRYCPEEEGLCEHQVVEFEVWKAIEGYEDYYEVSNFGRARSLTREIQTIEGVCRIVDGQVLKLHNNRKNLQVCLNFESKQSFFQIARLVWRAFINEDVPQHIHHKDEDFRNNAPINLTGDIT